MAVAAQMTFRDLAIEAIRFGSVVAAMMIGYAVLRFLAHVLDWLLSCRWRPISTAPQDGTNLMLLLWVEGLGSYHAIGWSAGGNKWHYDSEWCRGGKWGDAVVIPRAWRPLPRAPKWAEREA